MKLKHYRVSGRFMMDVEKVVCASSESEAKKKLRDSCLKNRKLKKSHWLKDEANIIAEW